MRKTRIIIACMVALVIMLIVQSAAAQAKLEGVWKITEVTLTGPNARTIIVTQPSLVIFTRKHFSFISVESDKPRPDLPQKGATDAQKLAAWEPFEAFAGTYEVKGTTFTGRGVVSKNPMDMKAGNFGTAEFKIQGNVLAVTMKADQNGPVANPYTLKLVRVE